MVFGIKKLSILHGGIDVFIYFLHSINILLLSKSIKYRALDQELS
jgi:hypothetical protein